jgi:type IV secretory pathway VirB2 component (pilin)
MRNFLLATILVLVSGFLIFSFLFQASSIVSAQEESDQSTVEETVTEDEEEQTEQAQTDQGANNQSLPLDQKINELYTSIVQFVAGPLAILFLVYAGYLYITSAGNPEQIGMAKEMIVSTIVAIIILLLAGLILQTIGDTPVPDANSGDNNGQEEQQQSEQNEGESESESEDESGSEEPAELIDADEEEGSNGSTLDQADPDGELNDD